jgi:hypothetical protein
MKELIINVKQYTISLPCFKMWSIGVGSEDSWMGHVLEKWVVVVTHRNLGC